MLIGFPAREQSRAGSEPAQGCVRREDVTGVCLLAYCIE